MVSFSVTILMESNYECTIINLVIKWVLEQELLKIVGKYELPMWGIFFCIVILSKV
jgi:hypothetical protein